jgi:hypothetical protein
MYVRCSCVQGGFRILGQRVTFNWFVFMLTVRSPARTRSGDAP